MLLNLDVFRLLFLIIFRGLFGIGVVVERFGIVDIERLEEKKIFDREEVVKVI